jgi:hypothetical protein
LEVRVHLGVDVIRRATGGDDTLEEGSERPVAVVAADAQEDGVPQLPVLWQANLSGGEPRKWTTIKNR